MNSSGVFSDINECGSNPCDNSGSCEDKPNGFECKCSAGYTGVLCQTGMYILIRIINLIISMN